MASDCLIAPTPSCAAPTASSPWSLSCSIQSVVLLPLLIAMRAQLALFRQPLGPLLARTRAAVLGQRWHPDRLSYARARRTRSAARSAAWPLAQAWRGGRLGLAWGGGGAARGWDWDGAAQCRVNRVFRVPWPKTRTTRINFGYRELEPVLGFGFFGLGFFGFGLRVSGFFAQPYFTFLFGL